MVPNHVSSIWDPPAGNVTLACMVVVDDLHGVSESFRKRGRRWRGIPRAGYRCSYEPRRSTWNTPRNLNVSNLQLPQRICRSNLEQPAGNRNRAGKVSLRPRSLDFIAIGTTSRAFVRHTPHRVPRGTHIDCTAVPRGTWTEQKVIRYEPLPHLHKILRYAHSCALHSKLNGIILRPSLDSLKTKWDA
jgi:hypothetical protein